MARTRVPSSSQSGSQLAFDLDSVTPPPRPELRELWTPDDIFAAVLRDGPQVLERFREDNRIEYKSSRYDPKDLGDYLSMWANTQPHGGIVVVGIENDGAIGGCMSVGTDRVSLLERVGADHCPDARYEVRRVAANLKNGTNDYILVFRVEYRPDRLVETVRGDAFVRAGDKKRKLLEEEKREIRISKGEISYELEPVNIRFPGDFDDLLVDQFCRAYREKRGLQTHHSREQILALNHLGAIRDGVFVPNLACALIFALDPRRIIPGCRIRFMKFEGTEEKSGQQYNVVRDVFIDGPLPIAIQEAEQVIANQIRQFTRLGPDGKFYTKPEYPNDVWLEAIVNACVHRSYNYKNMNIFVKMFDNRLVVESPGGFPPPVNATNIYETHNPRNPHLMGALFYLDFVKCAHEGTRRMRDMMKGANLPAPEFAQKEISGHQVHVTLRNNIEARKEFVDAGALKILGEKIYDGLSQQEKQIINYIAEHSTMNVTDANRLLHIDWQTAKKLLEGLVAREILTRRSQTGKERDPKARYTLKRRQND